MLDLTVLLGVARASHVALVVKNPPVSSGEGRDTGSIPGLGRSPGGGHSNPLQYSCLENPTDRGAWQAAVHRVANHWTRLKQPSMHACRSGKCFWDCEVVYTNVRIARCFKWRGLQMQLISHWPIVLILCFGENRDKDCFLFLSGCEALWDRDLSQASPGGCEISVANLIRESSGQLRKLNVL